MTFIERVHDLIDKQGTTAYVAAVLQEMNIQYVDNVPEGIMEFFLRRAVSLREEDKS